MNIRHELIMATSKFIPSVAFHPGVTLAEKLKEIDMSIKEFALRASKPEKTIHAVIKGESSVTSDMAVAFESVTRIPAHFWLNKQRNYDEYQARARKGGNNRGGQRMGQVLSLRPDGKVRVD